MNWSVRMSRSSGRSEWARDCGWSARTWAREVRGLALALFATLLPTPQAEAGLDRWTSTGPPVADSSTRGLVMHPLAPATLYAGTAVSGLFRSPDGGGSWVPIGTGLDGALGFSMAIDPLAPATLYLGTASTSNLARSGIFKSTDAGSTWTQVNVGLVVDATSLVNAIAVDPTSAGTVYAATSYGVYKSTSGGAIWLPRSVNLSGLPAFALAFDPRTSATLYAGTAGGGVSKSTDGAASWQRVDLATPAAVQAIAVDPLSPETVYAATNGGGVFKSTTGGGNWVAVNTGLTQLKVLSLAIDPANPATLYAGTFTGVFKSADGGSSWSPLSTGLFSGIDQVYGLVITRSGTCLHAATNGGVFDFETAAGACTPPGVVASVLPSSRSVQAGTPATAFATIINPAGVTASQCGIAPLAGPAATFSFQTTDPATNQLVGTANTPADIPPGGLQTYVVSFTPAAPFAPTELLLNFGCVNTASAPVIVGVDTLLLTASPTPAPDIVALAASAAGVVNVPGAAATGVFAVATVNVGAGGTVTVTADTGAATLPVAVTICETDPATSICLAPPDSAVSRVIGPGQTPTFGIFVKGTGVVPFDPAANRVFVRFGSGGITRGSTSVAVRTQ